MQLFIQTWQWWLGAIKSGFLVALLQPNSDMFNEFVVVIVHVGNQMVVEGGVMG